MSAFAEDFSFLCVTAFRVEEGPNAKIRQRWRAERHEALQGGGDDGDDAEAPPRQEDAPRREYPRMPDESGDEHDEARLLSGESSGVLCLPTPLMDAFVLEEMPFRSLGGHGSLLDAKFGSRAVSRGGTMSRMTTHSRPLTGMTTPGGHGRGGSEGDESGVSFVPMSSPRRDARDASEASQGGMSTPPRRRRGGVVVEVDEGTPPDSEGLGQRRSVLGMMSRAEYSNAGKEVLHSLGQSPKDAQLGTMFSRCIGEIRKDRYFYSPRNVPPPPPQAEEGWEDEREIWGAEVLHLEEEDMTAEAGAVEGALQRPSTPPGIVDNPEDEGTTKERTETSEPSERTPASVGEEPTERPPTPPKVENAVDVPVENPEHREVTDALAKVSEETPAEDTERW